jgi:DNA-binding HxlR family transcriptional regulator
MKRIALLSVAVFALAGCSTTSLSKKLNEFEKLGITEAEITGKFSHTSYKVEEKDGTRRAVLDHSNAWVPKVRIVREKQAK